MRIQRFPLFLIGLMLAVSATAQKEKDRGYWALASKKTFIDGKMSNGKEVGIISGKDREAHFLVPYYSAELRVKFENGLPRGYEKPTVDAERPLRHLVVTWTKPPQYVKTGEEDKITFDVKAAIDGQPFSQDLWAKKGAGVKVGSSSISTFDQHFNIAVRVGLFSEVTVGKTTVGFTMMQKVLDASDTPEDFGKYMQRAVERAGGDMEALQEALGNMQGAEWSNSLSDQASGRLTNDEPWSQNLALGKESYMMVNITTTYSNKSYWAATTTDQHSFTIEQYYLYKYYPNGGDIENTVRADDDDQWLGGGDNEEGGEDGGTILPPWMIPVGIGTIGTFVGYKLIKRRRKGDEDGPDEPEDELEKEPEEEPEEKDEPKKPSTYKMILYKNFGSKLVVGDEPKIVGARIEERTAEGKRIERHDLTKQIEIEQGENITIVEQGTNEKYRYAKIQLEEIPQKGPKESSIFFIFRTPGGTLKNKLVFSIEDGFVQFFQPNLTLPTGYEKTSRLPFVVHGVGDKAKVTATLSTDQYFVTLEKGEGEEKGFWFANITENHEVAPDKKNRKAGDYTLSHLNVVVKEDNGYTIEESIPVIRYNMGLVFECKPLVGCYAEAYNPQKHPFKINYKGIDVCPHMTEATLSLMTWDEEEHQLRRLVPADENTIFGVMPLPDEENTKETDILSKETKDMSDTDILQKVGLQFYVKEILEDGSSVCCIYARNMLDAPARRKVRLHVEAVYKGEKYEAEQDVWLTSQPVRHYNSVEEEREVHKYDEQITDNLIQICKFIINHDLLDRIGPVYRLAQMQLDGYDSRFGYDTGMIDLIRETYLRFLRGETLGANAIPEGVEYLGLTAELLTALAKTNQQLESWLDAHGGAWTRIAIGVATLGWSEPFMLTVRVADKMVAEANRPRNPGESHSTFVMGIKMFWAGTAEVAEYAGTEYLYTKTMGLSAECVAKYRPDIASNMVRIADSVSGQVKDKLGILGKDVGEVARDMKGFLTSKFGKEMKNRMSMTKSINQNAGRSADDAIRKFRQNSKWTPEEILEDELGRAANVASVKEIKEMERACIDYVRYRTPETKEAFRKFCYNMQKNKISQKQLAMYKSDWANNVRSEYYRLLQEDYRIIDKEALNNACKRLREQGVKVNEDDLFVFCATNSNAESLLDGYTLTRDRDLSMMFREKPTKGNPRPLPKEVPQNIAEECYGSAYKKRTGMTMQEGDQAVVQKGSKEMIGAGEKDLNRGFKKEHFSESFDDLDGVARAFEHKPLEWIEQGARLRAAGDVAGAIAKEEEGLRQAIKLYFNSMEKRATYRGTMSRIKPKEVELFHVMKKLEIKSQGPTSLSVPEFKKFIKTDYGMELTDVPKLLKDLVYRLES